MSNLESLDMETCTCILDYVKENELSVINSAEENIGDESGEEDDSVFNEEDEISVEEIDVEEDEEELIEAEEEEDESIESEVEDDDDEETVVKGIGKSSKARSKRIVREKKISTTFCSKDFHFHGNRTLKIESYDYPEGYILGGFICH